MIERSKRTHGCTGCARASGVRCPTTLIPNDGTIEKMAPFVVRRLRRCQLDRGRCRGSKLAASRHKPVETANGVARQRPGATRSDQAVPVTAKARLHGGCERGFSNSTQEPCFANEASPLHGPQAFVVDGDKSEAAISTTSTSISSRSTPPVLPAGTRPSRKRRRRRATTADY